MIESQPVRGSPQVAVRNVLRRATWQRGEEDLMLILFRPAGNRRTSSPQVCCSNNKHQNIIKTPIIVPHSIPPFFTNPPAYTKGFPGGSVEGNSASGFRLESLGQSAWDKSPKPHKPQNARALRALCTKPSTLKTRLVRTQPRQGLHSGAPASFCKRSDGA